MPEPEPRIGSEGRAGLEVAKKRMGMVAVAWLDHHPWERQPLFMLVYLSRIYPN
jgi:hypothetical protein